MTPPTRYPLTPWGTEATQRPAGTIAQRIVTASGAEAVIHLVKSIKQLQQYALRPD